MEIGVLRTEHVSLKAVIYEKLPTTEEEIEELVRFLTGQDENIFEFIFSSISSPGLQIRTIPISFKDEGFLADQSILGYVFEWIKNYLEPNLPDQWAMGSTFKIFYFGGEFSILDRYFIFFFSLSRFTGLKEFSLKKLGSFMERLIGKN